MLEYYFLSRLCGSLGDMLRAKGRNPIGYQVLLVVLWIGGEITGLVVGLIIGFAVLDDEDLAWLFAVGGVIAGAACAGGFVFLLAKSVPPLEGAHGGDPDDAYGPGWRHSDRERLRRLDDKPSSGARDDRLTDRADDLERRWGDDRVEG
jgi:hypothetical protein